METTKVEEEVYILPSIRCFLSFVFEFSLGSWKEEIIDAHISFHSFKKKKKKISTEYGVILSLYMQVQKLFILLTVCGLYQNGCGLPLPGSAM